MKFDSLKSWQKVVLVNAAALIGVITSALAVPPATPVWIWALGSAVAIVFLNFAFFRRFRRKAGQASASYEPRAGLIAAVAFPLYVLFLILSYYLNHR